MRLVAHRRALGSETWCVAWFFWSTAQEMKKQNVSYAGGLGCNDVPKPFWKCSMSDIRLQVSMGGH